MAITAQIYNQKGKSTGSIDLPDSVFGQKRNDQLVHQVVVSMESNARVPVAHTKDRSEVRGGGKKPWKQKGTGRARHGSRRSPIWVGGGVAHGPTNERNFKKKINKKMRVAALTSVLSQKFKDQEIVFLDKIDFSEPKTKEAKSVIQALGSVKGYEALADRKNNAACLALFESQDTVKKSFSNMGNILVKKIDSINPALLLKYKYLIIENPKESIAVLEKRVK